MAKGEYEATKALHNILPENIPEPVAHGTLAAAPSKHFFLAEFRDMSDELPDTSELASIMAKIHSVLSATGKFGFHTTTFQGNVPFDNTWCDTWEELFTRSRFYMEALVKLHTNAAKIVMRNMLSTEREIQGPDEEMDELAEKLLRKVIPRLIRPMETGGNKIKPVLLHADVWHGNVGIDMQTDAPVLYDCASFYGHNECTSTQSDIMLNLLMI